MSAESPVSFATLLRQLRHAAGLTQDELADRAHVSARTISDLERGLNGPRKTTVMLLADALRLGAADRKKLAAAARGKIVDAAPPASPSVSLPAYLTRLIGREADTTTILDLIAHQHRRLVTLIGTAGIGKTRLAVAVASQLTPSFPDGVYFIPLAQVQEWKLIPSSIAQVLGIQEEPGQSLWDLITTALATKTALFLLDNLEHLLEGGAFVVDLLSACPGLTVLITSRAALRVRGEQRYPVSPLASVPSVESGERSAAEELFIERAQEVQPLLPLTPANLKSIAAICLRLEGIPLAIELAAMRVAVFAPPDLLRHLDHRLSLLVAGPRDLPPRQQTMRDAVAWSYDLLDPSEQWLFRRLAVFVGGWTIEAGRAVCADDVPPDLLMGIVTLVEANLIQIEPEDEDADEPRYTMLEILREYGLEQLEAHDELACVQRRHAEYVLMLAQSAKEGLRGSEQIRWLVQLDKVLGNLRAALQWASEHDASLGLAVAAALWRYWYIRHYPGEGRSWLERFLTQTQGLAGLELTQAQVNFGASVLATEQEKPEEAERFAIASLSLFQEAGDGVGMCLTLNTLAQISMMQDRFNQSERYHRQALALSRTLDDAGLLGTILSNLGRIVTWQGRYSEALDLLEEGLAHLRAQGYSLGIAASLLNLSHLFFLQEQFTQSATYAEESLVLAKQIGNSKLIAAAFDHLGNAATGQGHYQQAFVALEQSHQIYQDLNDKLGIATVLMHQGDLAREQHEWQQAEAYYAISLSLFQQANFPMDIATCLEKWAKVLLEQGQAERAAHYVSKATTMCEDMDIGSQATIFQRLKQVKDDIQEALGADTFQAAWEKGKTLSLDELLAMS